MAKVHFETAGERKRKRMEAEEAQARRAAARPKADYDVGSTSHGLIKRLGRMEELERDGTIAESRKTKRDIWAKLAEASKRKGR